MRDSHASRLLIHVLFATFAAMAHPSPRLSHEDYDSETLTHSHNDEEGDGDDPEDDGGDGNAFGGCTRENPTTLRVIGKTRQVSWIS